MGTRADFYAGKGLTAEWLGSIAWDGYRDGIPAQILNAESEAAFRQAVSDFLASREDGTLPAMGWPWPWDDSGTSDCSYWHFDGHTYDEFDSKYVRCDQDEPDYDADGWDAGLEAVQFPNMAHLKATTFGKRSGVMVFVG